MSKTIKQVLEELANDAETFGFVSNEEIDKYAQQIKDILDSANTTNKSSVGYGITKNVSYCNSQIDELEKPIIIGFLYGIESDRLNMKEVEIKVAGFRHTKGYSEGMSLFTHQLSIKDAERVEAEKRAYKQGWDSAGGECIKNQQEINQLVQEAVRLALEKHHSATLTAGKVVDRYQILERIDDKKAGHTKKLLVMCRNCGSVMFRTNNRLKTEHRYCINQLKDSSKKEQL